MCSCVLCTKVRLYDYIKYHTVVVVLELCTCIYVEVLSRTKVLSYESTCTTLYNAYYYPYVYSCTRTVQLVLGLYWVQLQRSTKVPSYIATYIVYILY